MPKKPNTEAVFLWVTVVLAFIVGALIVAPNSPLAAVSDTRAPGEKQSPSSTVAATPQAQPRPTVTLTAKPEPKKTKKPKPEPKKAPRPKVPATPPPTVVSADFVVSSFNVLGHSHTRPGGNKYPRWAQSERRTRWTLQLLNAYGVSVAGLQEFEVVQARQFRAMAPGWGVYTGSAAEGIVWREAEWELVSGETVGIPYFKGKIRQMPVVLLRHRGTGLQAYFATFHNPASVKRVGDQSRWRARATALQIQLALRLIPQGHPVFFTGDMNERESYFCKLAGGAPMIAANGGSHDGACSPPKPSKIDWIFGSEGVRFSGYVADRGALVQRTSDHPIIVSRAHIQGTVS